MYVVSAPAPTAEEAPTTHLFDFELGESLSIVTHAEVQRREYARDDHERVYYIRCHGRLCKSQRQEGDKES